MRPELFRAVAVVVPTPLADKVTFTWSIDMKYAKIINNTVDEIFVPQAGFTIEASLHPSVCALFEAVPDEVEVFWKRHEDGTFSAPTPPTIPVVSI